MGHHRPSVCPERRPTIISHLLPSDCPESQPTSYLLVRYVAVASSPHIVLGDQSRSSCLLGAGAPVGVVLPSFSRLPRHLVGPSVLGRLLSDLRSTSPHTHLRCLLVADVQPVLWGGRCSHTVTPEGPVGCEARVACRSRGGPKSPEPWQVFNRASLARWIHIVLIPKRLHRIQDLPAPYFATHGPNHTALPPSAGVSEAKRG